MSEVFLVNHQVKFEPNCHVLTSIDNPQHKAVLPAAASRCFSLLLARRGEIITIKQFHRLVWSHRKTVVSDNTVYQTISIIRKSLASVGASKNIIETRTRRGWSIPDAIPVVIETGNEDKFNNQLMPTVQEPDLPVKIDHCNPADKKIGFNKKYNELMMVVLLLIIAAAFISAVFN